MPAIQFQFHASPDELLALATEWAQEHELHLALEQFFPKYKAVAALTAAGSDAASELEHVGRVSLSLTAPDLDARSAHDFVGRNPGSLFVSIGKLSDDGLRESALGSTTRDEQALRIWQTLVDHAKSAMHKGAIVRNPHSGSTEKLPAHRHTPGAHDLAERGVKMLAAAGWNEIDFADLGPTRRDVS